ncbi:MAG: hypothetical protein IKW90_01560 [Lachnospiraceae bacterium]|nr:hypothetical protein [Lachnospiraceae bacterium]
MSHKYYCSVIVCIVISVLIISLPNYYYASASEAGFDITGYDDETRCAIAMNGIEYNGVVYFTKDNMLYRITPDMAKKGKKAQVYLKNVDTESGLFEISGYIYFKKIYTHSLYRIKAGDRNKELVSKGVYKITNIDEGYIFFWGKKYFYRVKADGSNLECLSRNKLNAHCSNEVCSTACVFNEKMFYSKGFRKSTEDEDKIDHKLYVQNLETKDRKTLLNPDGCNGTFYLYEIDGKLFAQYSDYGTNSRHTYIYNPENEAFERMIDADLFFNPIIGTDGTYLYSVNEHSEETVLNGSVATDTTEPDGTWKIYRIGPDWKQEYLFDVNADKYLAYNILKFIQKSDDYYIFKYFDEKATCYCVDSNGNIVYYQGFDYADTKDSIDFDNGTVDMVIKDGILYTLSHSIGIYVNINIHKLTQ